MSEETKMIEKTKICEYRLHIKWPSGQEPMTMDRLSEYMVLFEKLIDARGAVNSTAIDAGVEYDD